MKFSLKDGFYSYFKYFYSIIGRRLVLLLGLSIMISLMDGLGLTMFIPLLKSVGDGPGTQAVGDTHQSMGQMQAIVNVIRKMGFELTITTVLVVMASLFVVKGLMKYTQMKFYAGLRELFIRKVRHRLVNNLEGLSYSGFLKIDSGKIQNTLTVEVQRLFTAFHFYFSAAQGVVMLLTYMTLAFLANYQFALLVIVGGAASNVIYRRIYKATKKASVELSHKGANFNSFLVQTTQYFKYLKSTNHFSRYAGKLKSVINQTEGLNKKIGHLTAIVVSIKEPIIVIIVTLVIFAQVTWMGASLGSIILSLLLFYRSLNYLVMVQNYWQDFNEHSGGVTSVTSLTKEMASLQEVLGPVAFKTIQDKIEIRDVSLSYDKVKVLDGVNIELEKNATIALVGESGAGKTTLANMISGLIRPDSGEVYIDNVPMAQYNLNTFRDTVGYISQEPVVFNDTIFNNITFWSERTPDNVKRFKEVLQMASLNAFVEALPEKEETRLGDNGILISGGQRQRISIARELYKHTEVLIFDEATSALDSETEKIIQENIEQLRGNRTIVLIAHRLSTIKEADTIYLLEKGKVTASGSFEEMVNKSSRFQKMVSLQGM
ncbi:MAG: ABC transporter ATP-binding protein [Niastella sp.]|uniref:ABC transporter ATP-binding protein n=1 Tax=Niastella sp. TaxID=1869183 RepID=UPI003899E0A2